MAAGHLDTVLEAHDCASVRRIKEFMRAEKSGLLNAVQFALHVTLDPQKFAVMPHNKLMFIEHDDMPVVIALLEKVSEGEWHNTELLGRLFDALWRIARRSEEFALPKALTAQRMCDYMLRGRPFFPRHVVNFLTGISQLITMGKGFDPGCEIINKECLFRLFHRFNAGAGTARDWSGVLSSMCYVLKNRWGRSDADFMSRILRDIRHNRRDLCEKDVRQVTAAIKMSVPPEYKGGMLAIWHVAMAGPPHASAAVRFMPPTGGVMASSPLRGPAMAHTGFSLGRAAMSGPAHTSAAARFVPPTGGVMASSPLRGPAMAHTGFSLGRAAMSGPPHAPAAARFVPPIGGAVPGQLPGDPVLEQFDRIMRMPPTDRKRLLTLLQLAETAASAAEMALESPTFG